MSVEAIGQLLQQEGIPYHHLRDKEEILKLARHVIQSKLCGPLKDSSQYGESSYIKWVVICALVWTVLRLIASGNLSLLQGFLGWIDVNVAMNISTHDFYGFWSTI